MTKIPTRQASDVAELIEGFDWACEELRCSSLFCRGVDNTSYSLTPAVFREHAYINISSDDEQNRYQAFMEMAPVLSHGRCPAPGDYPGWLSLMQQYRCPTRLLDWSTSLFVAVFFACCDPLPRVSDSTSAIWFLSPNALNYAMIERHGVVQLSNTRARPFVDAAFSPKNPVDKCIAVSPIHSDPRHSHQASVFTLHGSRKPLEEYPEATACLRKLEISNDAIGKVIKQMISFGVKRTTIFPDLENLSNQLRATYFG
jgi:hypothetical protein